MKKQLALAVALAAAPFAALAGGHSYTYIEAGYARLDQELPSPVGLDVDDIEAGGFYLAGSVAVAPSVHVFGAYRDGDDDVGISLPSGGQIASAGVDMSQGVLGVGWHHDLREREELREALRPIIGKVWRYCEGNGMRGRTLTLKVKFADFQIITRSRSVAGREWDAVTMNRSTVSG